MTAQKKSLWFVYIVRCADNTLYTGCTNDLEHRLLAHNSDKGAQYTKGRGPVELVYTEAVSSRSEAQAREYQMKRLSRKQKLQLVRQEV